MVRNIVGFGLVGVANTVLSYLAFVALLGFGVHYAAASAAVWAAGLPVSFALNKRVSFSLKTPAEIRECLSFAAGCVLQLLLALAGFALFLDGLGLGPTPAYWATLTMTASFSFLFMKLIVFRRRARGVASDVLLLPGTR
jgi:putative flippase GtrA